MTTPQHWLTYDARGHRRREKRGEGNGGAGGSKQPWLLLLLLLLLLAVLLPVAWIWYDSSEDSDFTQGEAMPTPAAHVQAEGAEVEGAEIDLTQGDAMPTPAAHVSAGGVEIDLAQPVAIQTALPLLLSDDTMVVYVVDDSGSMAGRLRPLHEALREVADKPTDNTEIAMLKFGDTSKVLFDFTKQGRDPWDDAIAAFTADSGGTAMFTALVTAKAMFPDQPVCRDESRLANETICRKNRIVLMSDGMTSDGELAETALSILLSAGIPVDTIAFGDDADKAELRRISDVTGGTFIEAYH